VNGTELDIHLLEMMKSQCQTPKTCWNAPHGECCVFRTCDDNIQRTLDLTREMITLADQGDASREDTGCGILYGVLRDAAYKLRQLAEKEKERHQAKGWWTWPKRVAAVGSGAECFIAVALWRGGAWMRLMMKNLICATAQKLIVEG
jgi:hypothetical protein